ncbi:MAG: response regulator, partial [Chitinophagaceae bacterium]
LQLDSQPGKGSTFYFTLQLPLEASVKSFADPLPATQYTPFTGIRALIAEDNPVNLNIALKFLEKWGIVCSVAEDGKEALAVFNSGTFDLIILDIEMPVMDGRQVIQEIRKKDAHLPALAFTADILGQQTDELLQLGFTDHIHKPFQPVHLYEKIQALLFSKQNIA